ncbi:TolC family protein [Draconibacterium sp. IB214405]|uniref:TolC family protein n=1 Tax=Draconibacterium sp. IB214405 TaxID=3097352 RepID=UPI002A0C48AA|nr:TolC family protein [Draconibacterium sp. IB214405]MDX8338237.1 TolC family protein [Draconibacterium sp. IB214405]
MNKIITLLILLATGLFAQAQQPLSLTDAIGKALENNYNIVIAKQNQQIAEIDNNWGTAGRYPYINLSLGDNNSLRAVDGDNTTSVSLSGGASVNWTIFDGFSVKITKSRLEELENLSKNNTAVMVESTIQSVILAYYDVLLQKEILATYYEVMQLSQDRFQKTEQQKEYGSAVTYDVLQAQNAYLADRASYLLQEVAYKNSKRNLAYLMAEKEAVDYDYTNAFEAITQDYTVADLRGQMIENNKSLQNQYINQRLLQSAVASAKSSFSPSLGVTGGVTGTHAGSKTGDMDMDWGNSANFYGNFTLSWNLFSGGNRKRALQIAEIDSNIGEIELTDMQHDLDNSLANLFEFYQVRKELLTVADENLAAAQLNLQISRDKFEAGAINSFNYRDVQEIYLRAAQGRLQAIYNFINAQTSLLRLTGVIVQEYE